MRPADRRPRAAPIALLVAVIASAATARADPGPDRATGWHGSIGAGGSLLATGAAGHAARLDAAIELQPWRRLGVLAAGRACGGEPRDAILTAGLTYQAAAARPRLALALYVDAGVATGGPAPVIGAGLRTTIAVVGPLAVVLDTGAHVVVDGGDTRLVIGSAALLAVAR